MLCSVALAGAQGDRIEPLRLAAGVPCGRQRARLRAHSHGACLLRVAVWCPSRKCAARRLMRVLLLITVQVECSDADARANAKLLAAIEEQVADLVAVFSNEQESGQDGQEEKQ